MKSSGPGDFLGDSALKFSMFFYGNQVCLNFLSLEVKFIWLSRVLAGARGPFIASCGSFIA